MKKIIGLALLLAPLAYGVNGPVIKPTSNLSVTSIRFPNGTVQVSSPTSTSPGGSAYQVQISSGGVFTGVPVRVTFAGGNNLRLNLDEDGGHEITFNTADGQSEIGLISVSLAAQNMDLFAPNSVRLLPEFGGTGPWEFDKHGTLTTPDPATISGGNLTLSASTFTISGVGAPANSQALCLLGGQLGHCTSVVSVTGGCTCVAP